MTGQSRLGSLSESIVNIAIGYAIAVVAQIVVFPWFGIQTTLGENLTIGAIFTAVSLARSYALRRVFNWLQVRFP